MSIDEPPRSPRRAGAGPEVKGEASHRAANTLRGENTTPARQSGRRAGAVRAISSPTEDPAARDNDPVIPGSALEAYRAGR
jgi:hypothetical protein